MNYTLNQIAKATGAKLYGNDLTINHIAIDSRSAEINSSTLFVALSGVARDGHTYVYSAAKSDCKAFLVEHLPENWAEIGSFLVVTDTLFALQELASMHRASFTGEVIAITGSNGKTTVKEWFSQLWDSANGKLFRSPRSYNSQIGVALSLLMIEGDERVAIIEAGISKCGEMARLQEIIRPTLGIITNIGDAHSENFKSDGEKLSEKLNLFKGLTNDKIIRGDKHKSDSIEEHNKWCVAELYKHLGISYHTDRELLSLSLRMDVQQGVLGSTIINDSYSNDFVSLSASLDFARRKAGENSLHLITTDIEQSALSDNELYSALSELLTKNKVQKLIAIGSRIGSQKELFKNIDCQFYETTEDYLKRINPSEFSDSTVLIKGARSFETERISSRLEERTHTTTLEVNLSKIAENFKYYEEKAGGRKVMAMVKASSYGLGALQISRTLCELGVHSLAVAYADEGIELRRGGITAPIWVMNSDPGSFRAMINYGLEPEIYSLSALRNYVQEVKKAGVSALPIHIKIDSGMHRLGFMEGDIDELCSELNKEKRHVKVATIFTHFAAADDPNEDKFTLGQINFFEKCAEKISQEIGYTPEFSVANTAGIERFPSAHKDIVRLGIGLYEQTSVLRCKITQIKRIKAGETIGYNRQTTATEDMVIAIIPIGYADGMNRLLGCRRGKIAVNGILCDIVGKVCMDTTIIDITKVADKVNEGDQVDVMGGDSMNEIEIAKLLGTISYEVLTSISPRIKRLYVW